MPTDQLRLLAEEIIKLYDQIEVLKKPLEEKKDIFRTLAEGQTLEVPIEGFGKVAISKPREASTKTILELVKEKIDKNQELKNAMISKGILREIEQKTPAAKASITIKSNI
jgi:hypothetical protein